MADQKATNIHWHEGDISRGERWQALGCKGATLWFTGLSGSGKSTVASALEQVLSNRGINCYRLDGDNIRFGLNKNLGFSAEDRTENIRRIGEVAKLFADAGVIALTSFISPYVKDRDQVRQLHKDAKPSSLDFIEVYVDTPIDVCEKRDPKGLYKKARAALAEGKGMKFTGIDDPYEAPVNPELTLKTATMSVDQCVQACLDLLARRGILDDGLIAPLGGTLVDRLATGDRAAALTKEAATLPRLNLTAKQSCDLELIANGGYSPLTGFMGQRDFESVCRNMTLANGTPWSIPILLSVDKSSAPAIGSRVALYAPNGTLQGVMTVSETFTHDKKLEIPNVFRTEDPAHPGVAQVLAEGDTCVGGPVEALTLCVDPNGPEAFMDQRLTPAQTRAEFRKRGWKTIVAFQTRNPIHRAHEYVCKSAQEICDGLLIHPLVGETKKGDIAADVRMEAIGVLAKKYFNPGTTAVSVLPAAMRYAGPREAIHHAIMRRNYGCSHFIVGRDHAGVGNYYGTYDAQKIFDQVDRAALGIQTLNFEHTGYSKSYGGMVSGKTYPKIEGDIINLSGTAVRDLLFKGERPPVEFSRPEVADVLIAAAKANKLFVQ